MSLISLDQLRRSHQRYATKSAAATILKERANKFTANAFDVFLSHSYTDAVGLNEQDVLALIEIFEKESITVYIDWQTDSDLDRNNVSPETAKFLRFRMRCSKTLLYLSTVNASKSKWMPWELGFFDGYKGRVAILPISTGSYTPSSFHGQEYLGLYDYVTYQDNRAGKTILWVFSQSGAYVPLKDWINGSDPVKR